MPVTWQHRPEDRALFERELSSFLPDRIYDMHAHLWRRNDWQGRPPPAVQAAPPQITLEVYRECMAWILPDREIYGLHFAFPAGSPNDPVPCNAWVSQQVAKDPLARCQFYVRPTDDPDWVAEEMQRLGLRGLKPFSCFAPRPDKENAEIPEYLPARLVEMADRHHWSITLHMVRARSLADPSNQHWIGHYCDRYPRMTLILDHCARGFNPYHAVEGLPKLQGLPNLYVDTSVATSPLAVLACIEILGVRQVLYGSDFYCSHLRGTNLPVGDSFLWLYEDAPIWSEVLYGEKPVLLGLENLRAIRAACQMLRLSDRQVEAIFWGNAVRVLGL